MSSDAEIINVTAELPLSISDLVINSETATCSYTVYGAPWGELTEGDYTFSDGAAEISSNIEFISDNIMFAYYSGTKTVRAEDGVTEKIWNMDIAISKGGN